MSFTIGSRYRVTKEVPSGAPFRRTDIVKYLGVDADGDPQFVLSQKAATTSRALATIAGSDRWVVPGDRAYRGAALSSMW